MTNGELIGEQVVVENRAEAFRGRAIGYLAVPSYLIELAGGQRISAPASWVRKVEDRQEPPGDALARAQALREFAKNIRSWETLSEVCDRMLREADEIEESTR